ncbi:energy transducer TonB [Microbulbifer agarilyticus]|uniref:energy transducer TonB n=1 Tax=Microbulbifer agarilyticus TaxID=260552 RepID=UPI001CD2EF4E|nr:energy transducer TonB [Microbulbifer agarilyticus]MCA0899529.1 TonB family protein [Microbulbifer agarilyticus]
MKHRLLIMVSCSFALHAWLLWAAPAVDGHLAPSGTTALKLGQLKLTAAPAAQKAVEAPVPLKPKSVKPVATKPEPRPKPVKPEPVAKPKPVKKPTPQKPTTKPAPQRSESKVAQPQVAVETNAQDVASAPKSMQQSVSDEPVLVERPAFASPPGGPVYPELARKRRQQGTVVVEVQLDQAGAQVVRRLLKSSGVASLDEAALKAVAGWNFLPYREGGHARVSRVQLPIRFAL